MKLLRIPLVILGLLAAFWMAFHASQTPNSPSQKVVQDSAGVISGLVDTLGQTNLAGSEGFSKPFARTECEERLAQKVANGDLLTVHIFVPLCDNENQGIVPVPARIGNGQDPDRNLYWGAGYGIGHFFKAKSGWQRIAQFDSTGIPHVLRRSVFFQNLNGTRVAICADAYDGAYMNLCLKDYFSSMAGKEKDSLFLNQPTDGIRALGIYGEADLLLFNGHNGLMDDYLDPIPNVDGRKRDAMAIACISDEYFEEYFMVSGGYPLLTTTNLLAPEAYVANAAILAWAKQKSGPEIRKDVGAAYHQYQKCGLKAGTNTFRSGWVNPE